MSSVKNKGFNVSVDDTFIAYELLFTSSVAVSSANVEWQAKASTNSAQDKSKAVIDERDMPIDNVIYNKFALINMIMVLILSHRSCTLSKCWSM